MKKGLLVVIGAFLVTAFAWLGIAQAQGVKFAFVNLQTFSEKSKKFMTQQQKLMEYAAKKQAEFEKKKEQLLQLDQDLKKQGPMLKPETRDEKLKEMGLKEMELKLFEKQVQTDLQNEQRELMELARKDMKQIIDKIRKEKNLTLVFDSMILLGADEALDITEDVIRQYDASGPAPAATKPAPAAKPAAPATRPGPAAPPKSTK